MRSCAARQKCADERVARALMQALVRGFLARKNMRNFVTGVLIFQCSIRCWQARKCTDKLQKHALMQALVHGFLARKKMWNFVNGVLILQRSIRCLQARHEYIELMNMKSDHSQRLMWHGVFFSINFNMFNLSILQMLEVYMPKDGNDLFYALSYGLVRHKGRHAEIRRNVAAWLHNNYFKYRNSVCFFCLFLPLFFLITILATA
jgi:hypothetical protein